MEGLAPPLALVFALELAIERGDSIRKACYEIAHQTPGEIHSQLRRLLVAADTGQKLDLDAFGDISSERRVLFEVIWRGLYGEPVLSALRVLREEIQLEADSELNDFMARLPFRALLPLLLLIFPAFLILLFGPLIESFIKGVS